MSWSKGVAQVRIERWRNGAWSVVEDHVKRPLDKVMQSLRDNTADNSARIVLYGHYRGRAYAQAKFPYALVPELFDVSLPPPAVDPIIVKNVGGAAMKKS